MVATTELIVDDAQASDLSHVQPDAALSQQPATNPLMLLQQGVERGMSPEQLRALVDLHEQWRAARAKEAFMASMNACQAEMPVIVRDAENSHTRSRYARLDGIIHQAKPVYVSHGFGLSFSEGETPKPGFKRIVCDITHREGHSERRWLDLPIDGTGAKGGKSSMNEVQGCISTGSYGQRVLICGIFNITIADTDLDGNVPPPRHDNPPPNDSVPSAKPRGQRQDPHPLSVSTQQFEHIKRNWFKPEKYPDGNANQMRADFSSWVREATGRSQQFDPHKTNQWTLDDYYACCTALGIPTLEDLQRDAAQ